MLIVKAFDLKFKYRKYIETRDEPKFEGLPDPAPFNRDDLYPKFPSIITMPAQESGYQGH